MGSRVFIGPGLAPVRTSDSARIADFESLHAPETVVAPRPRAQINALFAVGVIVRCGLPRTPMRLPRITALLTAAYVGSMTTACGPDFDTLRSQIRIAGDTAVVSISDAVAGEPVTITVGVTMGFCDELGPTKTDVDGMVVTIEPFDRFARDSFCELAIVFGEHTATVVFSQPGLGTVRVLGQNLQGDEIIVERSVTVN